MLLGSLPTPGDSGLVNLGGIQASMFSASPMGNSEPQSGLKSTALGVLQHPIQLKEFSSVFSYAGQCYGQRSLVGYSPWGCKRLSHQTTTNQQQQPLLLSVLLSRFSRVRRCATPQMAAHQASLSLGFSRQEHWSGLPFPSPMHESEK